jgi:hypothetical protein
MDGGMEGWMGPTSAQGTWYTRLQRTHTAKTGTSDLHAGLVALSSHQPASSRWSRLPLASLGGGRASPTRQAQGKPTPAPTYSYTDNRRPATGRGTEYGTVVIVVISGRRARKRFQSPIALFVASALEVRREKKRKEKHRSPVARGSVHPCRTVRRRHATHMRLP